VAFAIRRHPAQGALALMLLVGTPVAYLGLAAAPASALTTLTVTTNADSGAGSLRAALTTANATADDVEIDFNAGLGTITLVTALPTYGPAAPQTLTLKGNGVTVAGCGGCDVLSASATATSLTVDSITITGGASGIDVAGGGTAITLTNSTLSGQANEGLSTSAGAITVANSSITGAGGTGVDSGGGPITVSGSAVTGSGNDGIDNAAASTVNVSGSTVSGSGNDAIGSGNGSTVTVTDSTIANSGNTAMATGNDSTYKLAYDTFTGSGGGFGQVTGGTAVSATIFGTVLSAPSAGSTDCAFGAASTVTSQGYNYASDATCSFTQPTDKQSAADPMLGALGANGSVGQTMVPKTGSPLIDAIPSAACKTGLASAVTADERGITRPQGSGCDIGAVEVAVVAPSTPTTTTPPAAVIPNATTPHTGEPWAGSLPIVFGAAGLGLGLVVLGSTRRRRANRVNPSL
jgi:hypothetical protein